MSTTSDTGESQSYVFDQSRFDHERLTRQARRIESFAREALVRAGVQPGARVIDVGCGPLGALRLLAELVGPGGSVVGLDGSPTALAQARASLDWLGVHGVELVEADVNTLDHGRAVEHGSFDLAYCRLLLMYQSDPTGALRQIARLVRSGGRIVATDLLHDPTYPRTHPPVHALERMIRLFFGLVERKGGSLEVAWQYRQICQQAGLRFIEQRGWFWANDPRELLAWYRDNLLGMRDNLVAADLATDEEVNALVREMDASHETVEFGASNLVVDMIAEVP
jgi:ubiquinone/menaquinone biosynthesis C-methylase UbiE